MTHRRPRSTRQPFRLRWTCGACGHPLANREQHVDRVRDAGHAPVPFPDEGDAFARSGVTSKRV